MKFSDKLKLIRNIYKQSQEEFAKNIGISRSYLNNLEHDNAKPTSVFINCVSLTYKVDKKWLLDDNNNDTAPLKENEDIVPLIMAGYKNLNDSYKKFVEKQIKELLKLQEENEKNQDCFSFLICCPSHGQQIPI